MKKKFLSGMIFIVALFAACDVSQKSAVNAVPALEPAPTPDVKPETDFAKSETGTEKARPQPGKSNLQGKVFYNGRPAARVEVRLCVQSNVFGDCLGEKKVVKTDDDGEYLFANVEPRTYQIFCRVFDTRSYIFSGKYGFVPAKYKAEPDQTFFVPLTNLFKTDLKVDQPKPKAKIDGRGLEIKWEAYADAAFYRLELLNYGSRLRPLDGEKVAASFYRLEKPLEAGGYRLRITAFNANGVKIAQNGDGLEFTVGGEIKKN